MLDPSVTVAVRSSADVFSEKLFPSPVAGIAVDQGGDVGPVVSAGTEAAEERPRGRLAEHVDADEGIRSIGRGIQREGVPRVGGADARVASEMRLMLAAIPSSEAPESKLKTSGTQQAVELDNQVALQQGTAGRARVGLRLDVAPRSGRSRPGLPSWWRCRRRWPHRHRGSWSMAVRDHGNVGRCWPSRW